jgi:hypothetical protein
MIIERGIAARNRLELVIEIEDDLVEGQLVSDEDAV